MVRKSTKAGRVHAVSPVQSEAVVPRYAGPVTTIAASVPRELAEAARAFAGVRGFSKFVAEALSRALVDAHRAAYVKEAERVHGPVDADLVKKLEEALRS